MCVCAGVHSYAMLCRCYVGRENTVCQHSAMNGGTAISCCQSLTHNVPWSIQKKQFAVFTVCQSCLHTNQQDPSVQCCCYPAVTQSESEQRQSAVSQSCNPQLCLRNLHQCNLNHTATLTVGRHAALEQER